MLIDEGEYMQNLADLIENFIVGELVREQEESLLLQRKELASKLNCAPSQISYVLSTRFTPERGYVVESRRGSGGFVRVMRVLPEKPIRREVTASEVVENLGRQHLITAREQRLLHYMLSILDIDEKEKKLVLREAVDQLTQGNR